MHRSWRWPTEKLAPPSATSKSRPSPAIEFMVAVSFGEPYDVLNRMFCLLFGQERPKVHLKSGNPERVRVFWTEIQAKLRQALCENLLCVYRTWGNRAKVTYFKGIVDVRLRTTAAGAIIACVRVRACGRHIEATYRHEPFADDIDEPDAFPLVRESADALPTSGSSSDREESLRRLPVTTTSLADSPEESALDSADKCSFELRSLSNDDDVSDTKKINTTATTN